MLLGTITANVEMNNASFLRGADQINAALNGIDGTSALAGVDTKINSAGQATQSWTEKMNSLAESIGRAGQKMTALVTLPVAGFFTGAFMGASSLENAIGKTESVFGTATDAMLTWSEGTADAFGITQTAALATAGNFGIFFKGIGQSDDAAAGFSQTLIGLSADVGAFNDVSASRASEAIQSGLNGEYDSLQRLGVNITAAKVETEALAIATADGRTEITDADIAMARFNVIMQESTLQQGQFAKESGSAAGQMAIFRAKLSEAAAQMGEHLLPIGTAALGMLIGLLDAFQSIPLSVQQWTMAILAGAAAIGPLLIGVSKAITAFTTIAGLVNPVTLIIAAIVALGIAAVVLYQRWTPFRNVVNATAAALRKFATTKVVPFLTNFARIIGRLSRAFDFYRGRTDLVSAALKTLLAVFPGLSGVISPVIGFVDRLKAAWRSLEGEGLNPVERALRALGLVFPLLSGFLGQIEAAIRPAINGFRSLGTALQQVFAGDWEAAIGSLGAAFLDFGEAIGRMMLALPTLIIDAFNAIPWQRVGRAALDLLLSGLRAAPGAISGLWGWLTESVSNAFDSVWSAVRTGISLAWDAITDLDWGDFISNLAWDAFVTAIDWGLWIVGKIGDFASWLGGKIGSIPWTTLIQGSIQLASWLADKVNGIPWRQLLTGTIEVVTWLADKIGRIPWLSILKGTVAVQTWLADKIGRIPWTTIIQGSIQLANWLGDKINGIPWTQFIKGTIQDFASWLKGLMPFDWDTYISGSTITDFSQWVFDKVFGGATITIPEFPGWSAFWEWISPFGGGGDGSPSGSTGGMGDPTNPGGPGGIPVPGGGGGGGGWELDITGGGLNLAQLEKDMLRTRTAVDSLKGSMSGFGTSLKGEVGPAVSSFGSKLIASLSNSAATATSAYSSLMAQIGPSTQKPLTVAQMAVTTFSNALITRLTNGAATATSAYASLMAQVGPETQKPFLSAQTTVNSAMNAIIARVANGASTAVSSLGSILNQMPGIASGTMTRVQVAVSSGMNAAANAVAGMAGRFYRSGADAFQGLVNGARSRLGALENVVSQAIGIMARIPKLGNSPWPMMIAAGHDAMDGLVIGVGDRLGALERTLGQVAGVFGGADFALAAPGIADRGWGSAGVTTVDNRRFDVGGVTIVQQPGEDADALSRRVMSDLEYGFADMRGL